MTDDPSRRVPIEPQQVDAPLTRHAVFLVLSLSDAPHAAETARAALATVSDLTKNVAIRDLGAAFSCTVGIGSRVWDAVVGTERPRELHPFVPIEGAVHRAIATPGDLLFHIRSDRRDLCFEFERQLLDALGNSVVEEDETEGFRYFDVRDLLGFVDGTANPTGAALPGSTLVGDEDAPAGGGSYVVVQKYTHDLAAWNALPTETQESIMGRRKADNVELADAAAGQRSHKTLATIEDDQGEHPILRDNMPFGSPAAGVFGTYFIGYSRALWVIERMLQRMFVGEPAGMHDRLLDFSTPQTGGVFFVPAAAVLDGLAD